MSNLRLATSALFAFALTAPAPLPAQEVDAEADVAFALDQLEARCGHFFEQKQIDWNKVRKQFTRDAKQVRDAQGEFELLVRLLARLRDGHAEVRPSDRAGAVQWPGGTERGGYGMFWCRVGKKTFVKNAWGPARELGLTPGMEVSKVDGQPVGRWLDARVATIAELTSFSTDHQAMFFALHWGLSDVPGTRLKLELNDGRKKVTRTLTADAKVRQVPDGPAFYPGEVRTAGDLRYSTTTQGYGYVHVRRCKGDLPARMDEALAALADPPGLILDFRGNSGGGFDHEALFGRFVPTGEMFTLHEFEWLARFDVAVQAEHRGVGRIDRQGHARGGADRGHQPLHGLEPAVDLGADLVHVEVEVVGATGDLPLGHPGHVAGGGIPCLAAGEALAYRGHDVLDALARRELLRLEDGVGEGDPRFTVHVREADTGPAVGGHAATDAVALECRPRGSCRPALDRPAHQTHFHCR